MERIRSEILNRLGVLRPYAAHLTALGVAVFLGLTMGTFKLFSDPQAVDTADRWPFPQWAPYRAGPQREVLARSGLWTEDPTKAKAAAEAKVEYPPWRFIGTLQEGKTRIAVIELDQGKRIQRMGPGEALPNGAVITKIDTSVLTYDENGVEKALKLFGLAKTDNLVAGTGKK